jgi:hypothetical protein
MNPCDDDPLARAGIPRDPVVEAYKRDIDRTLLRENLKLTVDERVQKFRQFHELAMELRRAGQRLGAKTPDKR